MFPKVNQMLYYYIANSAGEESEVEYKSRIADDLGDAFLIEYPMYQNNGGYKRLLIGDELAAYYITDEGIKNYFNTNVIGFSVDRLQLVKIIKPSEERITKVQRRNFLRVPAELELAVKFPNQKRYLCKTYDVGGGGISFVTDFEHAVFVGMTMECWLLIQYKNGLIEHAPFHAEIVRLNQLESGRQHVMCKFVSIKDLERQKLIRYCFERQLEFRNR
ncbi:flagellar brake protein [Paenibacillus yanchengensis]|uniref:Flagellar brake protein n=1 Tax=Paenibacillus yanchengensis TaxID=2035833 RepID=A0ABW4YJZ2_9BACL